jgi:hypothetical protein
VCACADTGFALPGVFSLGEGGGVVEHAEDGSRGAQSLVVACDEVVGIGDSEACVEEREDLGAEVVA